MQIKNIAQGTFFTLFGLYLLVFRTRISNDAIMRWYRKFPNIKIWEKGFTICSLIIGTAFIVFGVLSLLGIIKVK
jgi:hypothetical protein